MGLLSEGLKDLVVTVIFIAVLVFSACYDRQIKDLPRRTFILIVAVLLIVFYLFLRVA